MLCGIAHHAPGTPPGVEVAEQVAEPARWQRLRHSMVDEYAKQGRRSALGSDVETHPVVADDQELRESCGFPDLSIRRVPLGDDFLNGKPNNSGYSTTQPNSGAYGP